MSMTAQGGGAQGTKPLVRTEELINSIVLKDVKVIEQRYTVNIPDVHLVETEYEKPVLKEVETIKYVPKEVESTKFITKEVETVKYVPRDVDCERPIIREVEYEKPLIITKTYEKPLLQEKVYEVLGSGTLSDIKATVEAVKELSEAMATLKKHLDSLREYKLIEEVVKIPKPEFYPVKVERVVWEDVKRTQVDDKN